MPEYTGSNCVISFVNPAGTLTMGTDYRSLSVSPSIGTVDASAGSDTNKTYLTTIKDGKYSWKGVAQTGGTALEDQLIEGTQGTLIIGREGTTSGKRKETVPVISMGGQFSYPYDGIVEISVEFQQNGARAFTAY